MLTEVRGGSLMQSGGVFAAASILSCADENYALFDDNAVLSDVSAAVSFFARRNSDFEVPVFNDAESLMQNAGMVRHASFTAMYLSRDKMFGHISGCSSFVCIDSANAHRWGEAVWRGFGGKAFSSEENEAADFYADIAVHPQNRAFALSLRGRFAATALIHRSKTVNGLYYFSTLPDERCRGCATALLDCVGALLYAEGLPLVLLATEEGLPFYLNYGLSVLRTVPMYSFAARYTDK